VRNTLICFVAAALAVGACKKDKSAPKQEDHNAAAPATDDLRAILAMMPNNSEMVASVDFAALRSSQIYKDHEGVLKGLAASQLEMIAKLCDFNPIDKIGSVIFAGKGKTKNGDMTALVRGLTKPEVMPCLTKAAAAPPPGFLVTVDGDYTIVEVVPKPKDAEEEAPTTGSDPGSAATDKTAPVPAITDGGVAAGDAGAAPAKRNASVALKFLDDNTIIVARRKGVAVTGAELADIAAGKGGQSITEVDAFMKLIDGTDTLAPVWFVISAKSPFAKAFAKYFPFDAAFGSARADTDLSVDITARMIDENAAKDFSSVMIRLFDSLKKSTLRSAVGPNQVIVDGRDVRVTLQETGPQLKELASKGEELMMALFAGFLGQ